MMSKLLNSLMLTLAFLSSIIVFTSCEGNNNLEDNNYTVLFETYGGSYISAQKINSGESINRPTDPTKTDCVFAGWYSDSQFMYAWNFNSAVTSDLTLYAKWYSNPIIQYETYGGTVISSHSITYNSSITEPSTPLLEGYVFAGWYSDSQFMYAWNFSTLVISDTTLYAKWVSTNSELPDMGSGNIW